MDKCKNFFLALIGIVIFSIGYRWFLVPAGLYSGGFTGIAQLGQLFLEHVLKIRLAQTEDLTGYIIFGLNVPLFCMAFRNIGKRFFWTSLVCVILTTLLFIYIPTPNSMILNDILLNAIVGGVVSGFGVGLTLREGASGGGTDIIGVLMSKNYPTVSVGKISAVINVVILIVIGCYYDLNVAAYSLVFSIVASLVMDKVHYQNIALSVIVISKKNELGEEINNWIDRGVTRIKGRGEHCKQNVNIYLIVVNKYEYYKLKKFILKKDQNAFLYVSKLGEVMGNFEKRLSNI